MTTTTKLWQRDARWGHVHLGNSKTSTLRDYGCLITSLAMVAGILDPSTLNRCHRLNGGFQREPRGAYIASFDINKCVPWVSLRYVSPVFSKPVPEMEMAVLYDHLVRDPAILEVDIRGDAGPAGHRANQHFVTAINSVDGVIHIYDPWDGIEKTLTPRYGSTNERAIWRVLLYEVE